MHFKSEGSFPSWYSGIMEVPRDYYLSYENSLERLKQEYLRYGQLIIAYDFDDTIYDYHKVGRKYSKVIELLKKWQGNAKFICFSASPETRYPEMWEYIKSQGIPCDSINENISGMPEGRKVYYNILLDDRAGLAESYSLLTELLDWINE